MKRGIMGMMVLVASILFLLMAPSDVFAQPDQLSSPPPVEQPLLREGSLAVQLVGALGLQGTNDEVEAENILSNAGISPGNGWIADYPVTPDIVGELRQSISDAAEAGNIPLDAEEALGKLDGIVSGTGISVGPSGDEVISGNEEYYPGSSVINNYYYEQGPPVVTYYTPPDDFYYLYTWIPYPFWYGAFWFPGYFILNDFHRTIFVGHRHFYVSNHFHDRRFNRVYRLNPRSRFDGRSHAGIGSHHHRGFVSTENRRSGGSYYNSPQTRSTINMWTTRQGHGTVYWNDHRRHNTFTDQRRSFSTRSRSVTRPPVRRVRPSASFAIPHGNFNSPQRSFSHGTHDFNARPGNAQPRSYSAPQQSFSRHEHGFNSTPGPRVNTGPAWRGGGGISGGFHGRR